MQNVKCCVSYSVIHSFNLAAKFPKLCFSKHNNISRSGKGRDNNSKPKSIHSLIKIGQWYIDVLTGHECIVGHWKIAFVASCVLWNVIVFSDMLLCFDPQGHCTIQFMHLKDVQDLYGLWRVCNSWSYQTLKKHTG